MKLSLNEAKLTGLWAGNCGTIQQVLISKFAFGREKISGLSRNAPQVREAQKRLFKPSFHWCQENPIKWGNFTVSRPKRTRRSRITKIRGVSSSGISGINWENHDCFYFFNEFPNLSFYDSWWPSFPAKKILNSYYRRYHYQCCIEKWICYITCCEVFWKLFLRRIYLIF